MLKKILVFLCSFILCCLTAQADEMPPETQTTAFGDVQLISCTTDLRVSGPLYLGVRALPNEGWQLDAPDLQITTSEPIPTALFTPFKQPYPQAPLYPISAVLTHKPTQPITFYITGSWRGCKDAKCVTEPIHLSLTLGTQIALFTPECSAVTLALSNTPIPMYSKQIAAYARFNHNNDVEVVLDFQKIPRTLMIYDTDKNPVTLDMHVDKKRATFTLPNSLIKDPNNLRFFARTYHHYYEIQPIQIPQNKPFPDVPLSKLQILQACFLFFLLSAAPIYWARVPVSSHTKFHTQTKKALILTALIGTIMLGSAILYEYQTNNLIPFLGMPIAKTYALILMSLGVLFIPASPLLIFVFLCITPKPFLDVLQTSHLLVIRTLPLLSFLGLTLLAFGTQLIFEKSIFNLLTGKKASKIWWIIRLPWFALMLYLIYYL